MIRKSPFAAYAAFLGVMAVGAANAAVVESNHIAFNDKATPLAFDFNGSPELAAIKAGSTLVGIESYWTFTPGAGQTGSLDLLASLYSPSFASGVDTKVGFSTTIDLAGGAQTASSTYAAQQGLTFSSQVISTLLGAGLPGVLPTELVGAGAGFSNLDTFFQNGGTAEGYIKLITNDPRNPPGGGGGGDPPGPGGDPVPEPASMLVWGGLAACAWANRRRIRKEQLAA